MRAIGLDELRPVSYSLPAMNGTATYSDIELLETRIAPAGLVTVSVTGGVLELTSDDGGHEFSIRALDATTVELSGVDGTLFRMAGGEDTDTLLLETPIKSLSVSLGDGQDTLRLAGLNLSRDIKIDLGEGANALFLDTVSTKGSLEIEAGAGPDQITVAAGVNSVKKDLRLELGDGDNTFDHRATLLQVGRNISYVGGANGDALTLSANIAVKGNTDIVWGAGANTFETPEVKKIAFGKHLTFDSTASAEGDLTTIEFSAFTQVLGTLKIRDGNGALEVLQASSGLTSHFGSIDVVTGSGSSEIAFGNSQAGAKSVKIDASASSSSSFVVGSYLGNLSGTFGKTVEYIGGAGADILGVQLEGAASSGKAPSFKIDLGDGNNEAYFTSLNGFLKSVDLTGGSGDDRIRLIALNGTVGGIKIDNGSGSANTAIQVVNSKVTGEIKVSNSTDPGSTQTNIGLFNSQIGGLSYTSDAAQNRLDFTGESIGGDGVSNEFTVKKAITIELGTGYNIVDFENVTNARVGKGIKIDMGDGTNDVRGKVGNFVTKSLTVTGGAGLNRVDLSGSGNLGAVTLDFEGIGSGGSFVGDTVPLTLKSLTMTSASTEGDSLTLARVQVLGKLNANLGAGASIVKIDDSVIGGPFVAGTGAGADVVTIDTDDSNTGTVFLKPVTLDLGDGDDMLTLGGNGISALVTAKSKFKADGGAGTNTLTNSPENIFAKPPVFVNLP